MGELLNGGIRHRCSPSNPCPLCGATDYDMAIEYAPDDVAYWCHKVKGKEVVANGIEYLCIKEDKETSIGVFNIYQRKDLVLQKRKEWVEEQRNRNPDWKASKRNSAGTPAGAIEYRQKKQIPPIQPLSHKELDERYRYFLSLLVLEDKHRQKMEEEWTSAVYPELAGKLLHRYPIRSLPPLDNVRFAHGYNEKLKNQSRKKIVAAMVKRFNDLRGIPGFYLRSGGKWDSLPESERWTFISGEGIIFPVYDMDGYLYRLRYRDDYHNQKVKAPKEFRGAQGVFSHRYDADGHHTWYWTPEGGSPELVYGPDKKDVPLNKWGIPVLGKAENKYKTLSSVYMKDMGDCIKNSMEGGSPSGSPYSIYSPEGAYNKSIVIGTEGEKKGMVASAIKGVRVVSVAGVGTFSALFDADCGGKSVIQRLKEDGMKVFVLCYDADKSENEMVSNAEKNFLLRIKQEGVTPCTGEWSGKFDKGLDDILLMGIDFKITPFCG